MRGCSLNAFLLLNDKGSKECHEGPPGAELGTLTSARTRSVEHTSRHLGDFFFFFLLVFAIDFFSFSVSLLWLIYAAKKISLSVFLFSFLFV